MLDIASLISSDYGVFVFFIMAMVSSYFPIPVIGFTIAALGASITDVSRLVTVMFILYVAVVIGDSSVYFITRSFSGKVMGFFRKFRWFKHGEKKTRPLFKKYEFPIVFISRFLNTELCVIVNYITGLEKYNYKKFTLAVLAGEFLYIFGYMTFGYLFKETWLSLSKIIEKYVIIVLLAIALIYIIYRLIKKIKKNGKRRTARKN
jgi:membrane protein DedA with SNARE-associated domain